MAVLAFHAELPWARGGFLGVDAFFVLSGYLITSLLLAEWRSSGGIALLAFWGRRARRLLPALFLMLIGVAFYAVFFAGRLELARIRGDALATICYVANWRPIFAGQSYFDQFLVPSPLRHTWSLGIEEQYYLVWPLLFLGLMRLRRGSLSLLLPVSLALLAASALLMALLFQPGHDPSRVYYGSDTRAQSLLVGATLAMLLMRLGPIRSVAANQALQVAALPCAAGLGWFWLRASSDSTLLYRGGFLMLALAVAVVIAAAVQPKAGLVGRLLSLPPLPAVGRISYGIYLWHWPIYLVLTAGRVGLGGYELFALRLAATLAVAVVSYHLVEMPIRRGVLQRWKMTWTLAPAGAVCLAVALVLVTRGGISPVSSSPAAAMPQTDAAAAQGLLRVMVIGDSIGLSLDPGLTQVGRDWNLSVWNRSILFCGFVRSDLMLDLSGNPSKTQEANCEKWRETWPSDVAAFKPDIVVMLFGGWDYPDHLVDGVTLKTGTPEWEAYVWSELEMQFNALTADGARLVLLTCPYYRPNLWASIGDEGVRREEDARWRVAELNSLYRRFAEQHSGKVSLIDLNGFASPGGSFSEYVVDGVKLREDGMHFTPEGSNVVAGWLAPQIAGVGRVITP